MTEASQINRSVLSGFAWQGATKFVVQILSWTATIVVARLLSPADYGVMAIVGIFTGILALMVDMGLPQGLIHQSNTSRGQEDNVFYLSLIVSVVLYFLLFFAAPVIASFFSMPILVELLRVAGFGLILASLRGVPLALTMRRLDFRYRSLVDISANLASLLIAVTLAWSGFGVWSLVWAFVASSLVTAVAYLPAIGRFPRLSLGSGIGDIVRYGWRVMGSDLLWNLYSKADVFIIGRLLGERLLGYYAMGFQLAAIPLEKLGTIFNQVAFPTFARLKADRTQSREMFLNIHRYLLMLALPIFLGMAAVAEELVVLLLTDKWRIAIPILQAMCVINALRISGMLFVPVLNGRGKAGLTLRYNLTSAIILPSAFLIGAQHGGITGVTWSWLIAYPVLYILLLTFLLRELGLTLPEFVRSARSAWLPSMIMLAAVMPAKWMLGDAGGLTRIAAIITVGVVAYIGAILALFPDQLSALRNAFLTLRKGEAPPAPESPDSGFPR